MGNAKFDQDLELSKRSTYYNATWSHYKHPESLAFLDRSHHPELFRWCLEVGSVCFEHFQIGGSLKSVILRSCSISED